MFKVNYLRVIFLGSLTFVMGGFMMRSNTALSATKQSIIEEDYLEPDPEFDWLFAGSIECQNLTQLFHCQRDLLRL